MTLVESGRLLQHMLGRRSRKSTLRITRVWSHVSLSMPSEEDRVEMGWAYHQFHFSQLSFVFSTDTPSCVGKATASYGQDERGIGGDVSS